MKTASVSVLLVLLGVLLFTVPAQAATQAQIDASVAKGMTWLATHQNGDGSWGTQNQVAETGFAVLKFETHAINSGVDPLSPGYPYHSLVRSGLDYIFSTASIISIGPQPAGDPDTDSDGIGVHWSGSTYYTGIVMMAIAASTHPEMTVNVAGSAVNTWTYKQVLVDAVDYLAWGQTDTGYGRGGWIYGATDNSGPSSDNSNTGYAVLGLAYAEAPAFGFPPNQRPGFSCTIPAFVRSELNIWIDYIQNDVNGDTDDGGSGYNSPDSWVNILKTGNLLFEMAFFGDASTIARVQDAVDYIVRHWNDPNYDPGWRGSPANYQATYATMKGLETFRIDTIDGIDWFDDFADVIVAEQNSDGSWPPCYWGDTFLATEWALLTLEKAIPPPPPPPLPVGGEWSPVNMPGLIAPWITLALIALAAVAAGISSRRFIKRW